PRSSVAVVAADRSCSPPRATPSHRALTPPGARATGGGAADASSSDGLADPQDRRLENDCMTQKRQITVAAMIVVLSAASTACAREIFFSGYTWTVKNSG